MLVFSAVGMDDCSQKLKAEMNKNDNKVIPNEEALQRHQNGYLFFKMLREKLGPLYNQHHQLGIHYFICYS